MSVLAQYVLRNDAVMNKLMTYILLNFEDKAASDEPLVVTVSDKQESRTSAQNRLYWMWLTQRASHFGTTKDYEHLWCKEEFLATIYNRDNPIDRETFATIKEVKKQWGEDSPQYQRIKKGVIDLLSTTKATTKQMTEYLSDIYACSFEQGVKLTVPEDLKWAAEGGWV